VTAAASCQPRIEGEGLPGRTPLVLARERGMFAAFVGQLVGGAGTGDELTAELLETGIRIGGPIGQIAAAFVAGRCDGGAEVDAVLEGLVGDLDAEADELDADARPLIEALFSLVLRGKADAGLPRLRQLAAGGGAGTTHDWLAAGYLAQTGDVSGWPALAAALGHVDAHTRLMATRHLAWFLPFDGQVVDGSTIDVRGRLLERLADADAYVAREVPALLAEAGVSDTAELLEDAAAHHELPEVREAAEDVLDQLRAEA
jgi:hypothetical protein